MLSVEETAQLAHELNRLYCALTGDRSQRPWEYAPEWQKASAIAGVGFHLERLSRGEIPSPAASHESWFEQKRMEGWSYGPIKDPEKKEHPCFLPWLALPAEQRAK